MDFSGNFLGRCVLKSTPDAQKEFGVRGGAALIIWVELSVCTLVPSSAKCASASPTPLLAA